jgi:hypothetical protein
MASIEEKNKSLVLEAFDTLFNKRDYEAGHAIMVAEIHPAQRPHRAGSRRSLQPHQDQSCVPQIMSRV